MVRRTQRYPGLRRFWTKNANVVWSCRGRAATATAGSTCLTAPPSSCSWRSRSAAPRYSTTTPWYIAVAWTAPSSPASSARYSISSSGCYSGSFSPSSSAGRSSCAWPSDVPPWDPRDRSNSWPTSTCCRPGTTRTAPARLCSSSVTVGLTPSPTPRRRGPSWASYRKPLWRGKPDRKVREQQREVLSRYENSNSRTLIEHTFPSSFSVLDFTLPDK